MLDDCLSLLDNLLALLDKGLTEGGRLPGRHHHHSGFDKPAI